MQQTAFAVQFVQGTWFLLQKVCVRPPVPQNTLPLPPVHSRPQYKRSAAARGLSSEAAPASINSTAAALPYSALQLPYIAATPGETDAYLHALPLDNSSLFSGRKRRRREGRGQGREGGGKGVRAYTRARIAAALWNLHGCLQAQKSADCGLVEPAAGLQLVVGERDQRCARRVGEIVGDADEEVGEEATEADVHGAALRGGAERVDDELFVV
eukprot:529909-Rhodomonas_salina.5